MIVSLRVCLRTIVSLWLWLNVIGRLIEREDIVKMLLPLWFESVTQGADVPDGKVTYRILKECEYDVWVIECEYDVTKSITESL